jgi:hypothetical protein
MANYPETGKVVAKYTGEWPCTHDPYTGPLQRHGDEFRGWLFATARRRAADVGRSRSRHPTVPLARGDTGQQLAAPTPPMSRPSAPPPGVP